MYEPPPSVASSRSLARPVRASLVVPMLVAAGLVGCGGAPALLQPAHPLAKGVIEYGAGVTTQVSLGSGQDEIAKAEADPAPSRDARTTRTWLRGAYQKAVVAPGIAPWIGGRAGLGDGNEASLVYTGRNLRLGARHAWLWESTALSVGGGLASILTRRASDSTAGDQEGFPPGRVDWSAHGVGLDLPVTFGWKPGWAHALASKLCSAICRSPRRATRPLPRPARRTGKAAASLVFRSASVRFGCAPNSTRHGTMSARRPNCPQARC
jgi:hypothetical protein